MSRSEKSYLSMVYAVCKKCGARHQISERYWKSSGRKATRCPRCKKYALTSVSESMWKGLAYKEAREADMSTMWRTQREVEGDAPEIRG
jgi:hypothetical protein